MGLKNKNRKLGKSMHSESAQGNIERRIIHIVITAAFPAALLLGQAYQGYMADAEPLQPENYSQSVYVHTAPDFEQNLIPHILPETITSLPETTPPRTARLLSVPVQPINNGEKYQVLANMLTLRDSPEGKTIGSKSISDLVTIYDKVMVEDTEWGRTDEGFIALSEGSRTFADKTLPSKTIATEGVVNYLIRLLWTETIGYSASVPEGDYRQAITNVVNVIDNRATSGIFLSTILGVTAQPSQFSGLGNGDALLINSAGYRFDKLELPELIRRYDSSRNPSVQQISLKKLQIIDEVVQDFLKNGIKNPFPKNVVCFKNDSISSVNWGTPYARDPASLGEGNRHSYFTAEACLGKSIKN